MEHEDVIWLLQDQEDEVLIRTLEEWDKNRSVPGARQSWPIIPADEYLKQHELLKTKQVDPEMIQVFQNLAVDTYLRLCVNNILMDHESVDSYEYVTNRWPLPITDFEFEKFMENYEDWACDRYGRWFISDYATGELGKWIVQLMQEENPNKKLMYIDQVLSVTHRRSDLSSWFIEGGLSTLDEKGEYVCREL